MGLQLHPKDLAWDRFPRLRRSPSLPVPWVRLAATRLPRHSRTPPDSRLCMMP